MIPAATFKDKRVALFGLGGSGRVTLASLKAGGADVWVGDDNSDSVASLRADADGALQPAQDLAGFDVLVLAPGIPLTHPEPHWSVVQALEADVPVIGDLEVFARERAAIAPDAPLVCVTGTNGKSTTTALIAHILRESGLDVAMGGNIGVPALELSAPADGRIHVIECSSYQIDLAPSLAPSIGVHLNLSPDHIDRHGTFENYAAIKERLIARSGLAIVGVNDAGSAAIADRAEARGQRVRRVSSVSADFSDGVHADGPALNSTRPDGTTQTATLLASPNLRGSHNAQNAAAALAVAEALGVQIDDIQSGLDGFPGLAHRMQRLGEIGGVTFVNDSKATNAAATENALRTYPHIFWIVGGRAKADGIDPLTGYFPRIEKAYLIGEASERFAETLQDVPFERCGTLEVATRRAAADAAASQVAERIVLLSPACASFDQFPSFETRGRRFAEIVAEIGDTGVAG